ncbi:MAG TPA: hypothetical protein DEF45_24240 [Rhodopirellula sp.]|nr:hypothetical protein [Rhodopirellula sp.]
MPLRGKPPDLEALRTSNSKKATRIFETVVGGEMNLSRYSLNQKCKNRKICSHGQEINYLIGGESDGQHTKSRTA